MSNVTLGGNAITVGGTLPAKGSQAPDFTLTTVELGSATLQDYSGKRKILNIFPSVDTGICAASVRKFNELAAGLQDTVVVNVSKDLPFAQARFCGAEGIDNVAVGSAFRSSFGEDYGVTLADGPMAGLLGRAVVVLGHDGEVLHTQLVPEITTEPDYDSAVSALS